MLSPRQESQELEEDSADYQITTGYSRENLGTASVPRIAIHPPPSQDYSSHRSSSRGTGDMSSSSHRQSSSSSRRSSKSNSKKDDWSDITDPEERRRVQNKLAQRKFRDKAKEAREREARDAINREQASNAYSPPNPADIPSPPMLPGLPWGTGFSMPHVISRGQAMSMDSRHGSQSQGHSNERSQDGYSPYQPPAETFEEQDYEQEGYYDESGSWHAGDAQSYHHYYGQYHEGDRYYQDDGEQGGYGGSSH